MADVPLGMFLSGGLDSSAIAALMAGMIDRPLETFSVAFGQRAFSELDYARQVATAIKANPHEIVIDDTTSSARCPIGVARGRADRAPVERAALFRVEARERARQGGSSPAKAATSSWPATEVSARARQLARRRLLESAPGTDPRLRQQHAGASPAGSRRALRETVVSRHAANAEAMFFDNFAAIGLRRQASLLQPRFAGLAAADAYGASRAYFDRPNGTSSTLDRLLYTDLKTYLVELLMKQDQMSMAASIESRVPFLDHHLVEFATALPSRMKLRGLTTKWILREAVKSILPAEILTRKKMGFPVPFSHWLRGAGAGLARDVLLDSRARQRGITDPPPSRR
jgi:asparagine synthase (glutamine-hydrolysing)